MSSQSLRYLTRLRLLKLAPSSSRSISASPLLGRRNQRGPGEGTPFRGNQKGVPADRGGMTIDDLIVPKSLPELSTSGTMDNEWLTDIDVGTVSLVVEEFMRRPMVRQQSEENGLTDKIFMKSFLSFRAHCLNVAGLEPALAVTLKDIIHDKHDVERLFPYFLSHARRIFPHLEAMDDLRMISDLTQPHNWYPEARTVQRKIFFHAGPTNSGKTYHALQRFRESKSGVFCGPLKLLASEVFTRLSSDGFKVDMVTGEERRFAVDNLHPSPHISCTVEMLSTNMRVEAIRDSSLPSLQVAVIDEIQMLRDEQRGWAWTRALLGVAADEVHLCGEVAAIDIVKKLLEPIGETVEVITYERKTPLTIAERGLGTLSDVQPADCIVCFSKRNIFSITKRLEMLGIKPAVIYGDLPPGTKLAQAAKYNDVDDPCNVLVATDAIGMGLNLNIRRIIFASTVRQGKLLPTYSALQIAGRAGRYGTAHEGGVVTTLRPSDLNVLKDIIAKPPIDSVGIAPTFDQIETFSFHLPQASFVRLLDIFVSVCSVSDHFFICTVNQMKELAQLIDRIPLPLKIRYTLCISPINVNNNKFAEAAFIKMARRFSSGQSLTADWLFDIVGWPPIPVTNLNDLVHLENVYEILDTYLWLSLRFPDMLPDEEIVRQAGKQVDNLIREGVENMSKLLGGHDGKQGSIDRTNERKARSAEEEREEEEREKEEEEESLAMPGEKKRRGNSVLERMMARGVLSKEEAATLKKEILEKEGQEI
uniref:ATP-dependent RNA helicase SUV3 homolog, mitochondrial n=1 Tax=Pristionchus pacificus TaxID=54126 RepID=A0A8R1V593_PRIPA